jgi:hypothetical protein
MLSSHTGSSIKSMATTDYDTATYQLVKLENKAISCDILWEKLYLILAKAPTYVTYTTPPGKIMPYKCEIPIDVEEFRIM